MQTCTVGSMSGNWDGIVMPKDVRVKHMFSHVLVDNTLSVE